MVKDKRQNYILNEIQQHKKVNSKRLAEELNVSEDTVRRDLNELDRKGLLLKIHGGAISTVQRLYHYNENVIFNLDKKVIIANKAVSLITDGMVIIISGGTTNLVLSRMIPKNIRVTIYTYSLPIAMQLVEHPEVETIFIGGKIEKKSMVTVGIDVIQDLSKIRADICFLGASSVNIDHGITEVGYEVSLVKKAMIASSDKVVSLVTSSKLNDRQNYPVCTLDEISALVTDLEPSNALLKEYLKADVKLL